MKVELAEEPTTVLPEYARIPIVFTVDRVLDVTARVDGPGGFVISERRLDVPYQKDYDALDGEGPLQWARRFDLSHWALFTARVAGRGVAGAAVAFDTPGLTLLEGRRDLALLWDIRVAPDSRRQGVGSVLVERIEAWAKQRGCRQLKVETQNTNAGACRFYERQGFELRAINRAAYAELPEEIQLLWYRDLAMPLEPVQVRPARSDDVGALAIAHIDSIRSIGPHFYSAEVVDAWCARLTPDAYLRAMKRGEAFFVAVREIGGQPAVLGFSSHRVDDSVHGTSVYVRGSAARRGIGTTLQHMAESHARALGAKMIQIEASLAAVDFYKANGFEETGRGAHVLTSGLSMACVFMRKTLAGSP
jgi:GNAT superfamily N-acetyltransferase